MSVDPITLQVMVGALGAACEEMGATLIRAAHSANIKERQDCSTAIFNATGELVMQAEHIPVHLGSMPAAVEAILAEEQQPGSSWILNDPYAGGTHLPDITLIDPVRIDDRLVGFAAARAHHADVGGPTPGGMPADSRTLEDEGVVISPQRADDRMLEALANQMRIPDQRLADLRAQRAANRIGAERLREISNRRGTAELLAGMEAVLDYAERRTREAIGQLPDGNYESSDVLEGSEADIELRCRVEVCGEEITIDFSGSAEQIDGNLNCPLSVTTSAAYFAVRVLTDPDAPASAGAYRPITVSAPVGSILNATKPAAVAAGNVETSSRVADLVLTALGTAAAGPAQGQGTMNNLTLSGDNFTYYETIGGGQGGCSTSAGPSAVHVAMSNTLNTPIETLEVELPIRVRELSIRRGSGGAGQHSGGDGLIKEIEALAPIAFTLITERRRHAPKGANGGGSGVKGRNLLNGVELGPKAAGTLETGDVLRIETPGGGGWGLADHA